MGSGERRSKALEFLEALEALRTAVAWEVQCESAARIAGSEALDRIHEQAKEEVLTAARKLACLSEAPEAPLPDR